MTIPTVYHDRNAAAAPQSLDVTKLDAVTQALMNIQTAVGSAAYAVKQTVDAETANIIAATGSANFL